MSVIDLNFKARNNFNLSHNFSFSAQMGKLYPMYYEEVYPGDKFKNYDEILTKYAPLISPVYAQMDVHTYYFFVPWRLCWKNWQTFITGGKYGNGSLTKGGPSVVKPFVNLTNPAKNSLAAFLRCASQQNYVDGTKYTPGTYKVDAMPFRGIQLIWNEWFRDENLQDEVEVSLEDGLDTTVNTVTIPTKCWEKDRYTSALPWQQRGDPTYLPLDIEAPVVGLPGRGIELQGKADNLTYTMRTASSGAANGYVPLGAYRGPNTPNYNTTLNIVPSISETTVKADLRAATAVTVDQVRTAFQIQRFLYNSGRRGYRYVEQILSLFGVRAPDASLQRPQFIGGGRSPIRIGEVLQTSSTDTTTPQGNRAGVAYGASAKHGFTKYFDEYGFVIGFYCVMPRTQYQQGISPLMTRETNYDYLNPYLTHLSMNAIKNKELFVTGDLSVDDAPFGYQDRYDELRHRENYVAGDFLDNLNHWTMARIFKTAPALNAEFVKADPTKRIFAVTDESVDPLWVTINHTCYARRPMPIDGEPGAIDHI